MRKKKDIEESFLVLENIYFRLLDIQKEIKTGISDLIGFLLNARLGYDTINAHRTLSGCSCEGNKNQ